MRDIRQDLRERLTNLERKRDQLQAELRIIEDESAALMRLLDFEDRRFPDTDERVQHPERPVGDSILQALRVRSLTKDEIRDELERAGYGRTGSLGRTTHLALVNRNCPGSVIGSAYPEL
ncbi:MAG: hypothetical protein JO007_05830 [Alphaproteobacteria bacterium]|nr:hypothetical protein [Alphaproteobacteria bacterium]